MTRRLRVAFVAPSLEILGGQAIQADRLLTRWQRDADVEAWLVPVNPAPPGVFRAARRIKYARTLATELTYAPLLWRELRKADVAHVFSAAYTSFLLAPLPAVVVARALGVPVVLNYRSGEAPDHLAHSPVARRVLRSVDRNVVPSSFLAEVFAGFGIPATIVPNLVDLERFAFRSRERIRPRVLSTRNFAPLYNLPCTLRAFAIVQQRHPDATLTLAGHGAEEPRLRRLVAELGLRDVTFTGAVAPQDIAALYAAHDVYLQSPNIDNTPTSVLEAYASGLPVVSTRAGGVPAILRDDRDGLLADVDNHEQLAAQACRLLEEPGLAQRLTDSARLFCERCTWQSVRPRWLALYAAVAGDAARAHLPVPARSPHGTRS